MSLFKNNVFWQLALPVPVLIVAALVFSLFFLPGYIDGQLAQGHEISRTILTGAGVIGLLLSVIVVLSAKKFATSMTRMASAMTEIADGKTKVFIPAESSENQFEEMAKATAVFKQNIFDNQRLKAKLAETQIQAESGKEETMDQVADNFLETIKVVMKAVSPAPKDKETYSFDQRFTAPKLAANDTRRTTTPAATGSEATKDLVS